MDGLKGKTYNNVFLLMKWRFVVMVGNKLGKVKEGKLLIFAFLKNVVF